MSSKNSVIVGSNCTRCGVLNETSAGHGLEYCIAQLNNQLAAMKTDDAAEVARLRERRDEWQKAFNIKQTELVATLQSRKRIVELVRYQQAQIAVNQSVLAAAVQRAEHAEKEWDRLLNILQTMKDGGMDLPSSVFRELAPPPAAGGKGAG